MNLFQLPTWFVCDNCKKNIYVKDGKYIVEQYSFCFDCFSSLEEECESQWYHGILNKEKEMKCLFENKLKKGD